MFERVLTVKYLTLKNSFIYLPSSLTYFKIGSCVQLIYGENQVAYFSVTTQTVKLDENTIGINSLYAKALGIKEDELIIISEISPLPTINSITISPLNNFEYEVLEMLADNIQSTLLEQIRVVNVGQKLVIWAGANLNVTVYLDDVKPVSPGMIDFLTEVVIQPKSENRDNQKSVAYNSIFNMEKFKSLTSFFNNEDMIFKETEKVSLLKFKDPLICRLAPLKELPFLEHFKKHLKPFNVFMSQRCVPMGWVKHNTLTTPTICSMSLLTTDIFSEKLIYVRLYVFEDFPVDFDLNFGQNLFVDHVIFKAFECDLGVRIIMKDIEKIPLVNEISIHTRKPYSTNIQEKFKIYLADNADDIFILNSDILMDIGENIKCSLKFSSGESKFCVVDDMLLRNCKYVVNADLTSSNKSAVTKVSNCDKYVDNVSNFKNIINSIESNFSFGENHWENFLITGKPGTGKVNIIKKNGGQAKIVSKLHLYRNDILQNN
ncbi:hypothetical protein NQ317_011701 [Molorchus minor]|uniref:Peroxisomal ATPase PEX1 N-terminal C-lobe domain-containing protein n=1 Tax=Molorchus minor TaxID=1323400 RepID=A0ABQ9JRE1_9CUCU|nr:hypothetical protein NQ317_011701 [Molorchus minor]